VLIPAPLYTTIDRDRRTSAARAPTLAVRTGSESAYSDASISSPYPGRAVLAVRATHAGGAQDGEPSFPWNGSIAAGKGLWPGVGREASESAGRALNRHMPIMDGAVPGEGATGGGTGLGVG